MSSMNEQDQIRQRGRMIGVGVIRSFCYYRVRIHERAWANETKHNKFHFPRNTSKDLLLQYHAQAKTAIYKFPQEKRSSVWMNNDDSFRKPPISLFRSPVKYVE